MQNAVLVIHLMVAAALVAVVLFQQSEGGALGMGGGGSGEWPIGAGASRRLGVEAALNLLAAAKSAYRLSGLWAANRHDGALADAMLGLVATAKIPPADQRNRHWKANGKLPTENDGPVILCRTKLV